MGDDESLAQEALYLVRALERILCDTPRYALSERDLTVTLSAARAYLARGDSAEDETEAVLPLRLSKRTYEALEREAKRLESKPNLVAQWVTERWVAGRAAGADV